MASDADNKATVIRTERGLTIAGTRITLYDVMDYVTADWPPKLIRDWLNLSDQQIADVMAYIDAHRAEVEAEYQVVLQTAEENASIGKSATVNGLPGLRRFRLNLDKKHFGPNSKRGRPSLKLLHDDSYGPQR